MEGDSSHSLDFWALSAPEAPSLIGDQWNACRWDFEKVDPTAASSDVRNPVVYVVDVPTHIWQEAQLDALGELVSRVPWMPSSAWPATCQDLANARRHLAPVDTHDTTAVTPAEQPLDDLLNDAFTGSGVCH